MADTEKRDRDEALNAPGQTSDEDGYGPDAIDDNPDDNLDDNLDGDLDGDVVNDDEVNDDEQEPPKLELEVSVENRSACERHVAVTVARHDVDRYYEKEYSELMPSAQVPGFRPGRAPRKLIESRFRKDVAARVKSALLADSLSQASEEEEFSAISEPEIDLEAVEIPDEGPFTFEFDLEVRPEFDVPNWKGLTVEKPIREITAEDVNGALHNVLANRGRLIPSDGPAEAGDYVTVNLTLKYGEQVLSSATEEVLRIRPVLSFRDGQIDNFGEIMVGVAAGETRQGEAELTQDAPNAALRGQRITADFEVLEVKKLEIPELGEELLDELGGFELEADLRDAVRDQLQRQLEYEQHQRAREQITAALTVAADWELPPDLLKRQSQRELQRAVLELRRSGFGDDEIQAHANQLRQNSQASTARALKEHFILERIAEDEQIDAGEEDYDQEIALIAAQRGESPRRVRARMEKAETMDVLRNQIIERKVIELILSHARFREVPFEFESTEAEAIDQAASGRASDIPEAVQDAAEATPRGRPEDRPARE